MSAKWSCKVEYQVDKTEAVVEASWIKDLDEDECPAYDPHRVYRGFWSALHADSPKIMLERVPEIPELTEAQEKDGSPGYYRVCILGIQSDPTKFETQRVRKLTTRGRKSDGDKSHKSGKQQQSSSSTTSSNHKKKGGTAPPLLKQDDKASKVNKNQALKANIQSEVNNKRKCFEEVDSGDYDSDDSTVDLTLVSDQQVKVLKSANKVLTNSLKEKCKEVGRLQNLNAAQEEELVKLRKFNHDLQAKILDAVPSVMLSCRRSTSSSRSSPMSSRGSSVERFQTDNCSRPRTFSSSSNSSVASNFSIPTSRTHKSTPTRDHNTSKRKSPPVSPSKVVANKRFGPLIGNRSESDPESSSQTQSKVQAETPKQTALEIGTPMRKPQQSLKKVQAETSNKRDHNLSDDEDLPRSQDLDTDFHDLILASSPLRQISSFDSSSNTIVDTSHSSPAEDDNKQDEKEEEYVMIRDCKILKASFDTVQARPLSKTNDPTYVKEMAVLIFGFNTLFNSSIKERKYAKENEGEKKPRKGLDPLLVEEIRKRLEERIFKEFDDKVPSEQTSRYSKTTVNRFIYEKIKRMRSNPKLSYLDENKKTSTEGTENIDEHVPADN